MNSARSSVAMVDAARCSGCGRCIAACKLRLFAFEKQGWRKISVLQNGERCTGCNLCAEQCPIDAISMHQRIFTPAIACGLTHIDAATENAA
jgi:Na+-translocating ferredoxin:NAD+ oxidoreductase RNF subunit RnfB